MPDPREAHRDEIFEGLINAALGNNVEDFSIFNEEWERIDQPREGHAVLRFAGPMRHVTATGICAHCGYTWSITGVDFTDGEFIAEMAQQDHLLERCPKKADCKCWVEAEDGSESWERCLTCDKADVFCSCPEGPALGPCVNPDAIVVFLDQPDRGER